jgi:hypothetical protein
MWDFLTFAGSRGASVGRGATPLSGRDPRASNLSARTQHFSTLARASLCLAYIVVSASGCLVLSTPNDVPPEKQTAPFLIAESAVPPLRSLPKFDVASGDPQDVTFTADVTSNDAGSAVKPILLVDYGSLDGPDPDLPWQFRKRADDVEPKTFADEPRPVTVELPSSQIGRMSDGCHTITLMVTHAFDDVTGCPRCMADSSQLTWYFLKCNTEGEPDAVPCDQLVQCPLWDLTAACPAGTCEDADGGAP